MKITIVLLGMLFVFLPAAGLSADPLFSSPIMYEGPRYPLNVAADDLNGDGHIDIAVSNGTSPNVVSILINIGDGLFNPRVDYPIGGSSGSICVIDLDGDNDKDIAVTDVSLDVVSVLKNNGDGTFAAKVDYSVGDSPRSVTAADLDGDLDNDLAVVIDSDDNVSVLLNNGDGTFASPINNTTGTYPYFVDACDYDADDDIDLAVINVSGMSISILLNNGDGTYAAAVDYSVGSRSPSKLCSSDLDGDDDYDLAICCGAQNTVLVYFNNGDGIFQNLTTYDVGEYPWSIFASDFDNDGDDDLTTGNLNAADISYLENNGDGSFAAAVSYDAGTSPRSIFAADFDDDGFSDLVVSNRDVDSVSVLFHQTPEGFDPNDQWPTYAHDFGRTSQSGLMLGDISGINREWIYDPANSQLINFATPVIANDIVYISYDQGLHAIDLLTGDPLWNTQTQGDYSMVIFGSLRAAPTIDAANNRIYFGTGQTQGFVCADATTGDTIWTRGFLVYNPLPGSPGNTRWAHSVIIGDAVCFGDENGQIYCLDKNTGADLYYTQLDDNVYVSPSYGLVDTGGASIDMLFWGTYDGSIYGMAPTGSGFDEIWHYINPNHAALGDHFYTCPTFCDGILFNHAAVDYASANDGYDGYYINLDPSDGSLIYSRYHMGWAMYSPPVVYGNTVYYAADARTGISEGSGITAVDIAGNSILWNYHGGQITTHASVSLDPYLFFGTRDGRWKILDANTGDLEIEYDLGGGLVNNLVYSTALAHGSDGSDYVVVATRSNPVSYNGTVYGFSVADTGPRPRLHIPQTAFTTGGSLTPPVQRTFTDVFTNTGTADLTYTATLTDGAAPIKESSNDMSLFEKKSAKFDGGNAATENPEQISVAASDNYDRQDVSGKALPNWVTWVDPYSENGTINGVLAPGESISFTFEIDPDSILSLVNSFFVDIGTDDPDYCPWLEVQPDMQASMEFTFEFPKYDSIETACTKLRVGRNGDFGDKSEAPGYALDYSLTGDCDPGARVYIYSGSPVICYENDVQEIVASHSIWSDENFYPVFDRSPAIGTVTTGEFDRFESGTFITVDSALAVEKIWWAPKQIDSCAFVIQRLRLYSYDGETHNGLKIGEAVDWDIPSDAGNTGGYDSTRSLIYQQGIEYGSGCQPNDARFGGMAFLGFFINDSCTFVSPMPPYGAYVADNVLYVYPANNFVASELDSLMQIPGYNIMGTESDLHSVMTFFNDYTLAAEDTLDIYVALTSVQNGTESDLFANVDKATQWLNDHVKAICDYSVLCGDANGDETINIADAVSLINYIFKGGPAPDPLCVGDANDDDTINIADAVYLINYIFKGGPAPVEPCCP